jgi:hypothetical protein
MAYDEILADLLRTCTRHEKGVTEKKMFGGLAFMLNGNMWCGVTKEGIMFRVGPELYEKALKRKGAREMDFTGRPLRGMIYVDPVTVKSDAALTKWVQLAGEFVRTLPSK